jgi:small subunit ribosomal protein S4
MSPEDKKKTAQPVETSTPVAEERKEEAGAESIQSEESGQGLRYQKTSALCRRCRRLGVKLFLKGEKCLDQKCPFIRRKYAPGIHGQKPVRLSDYGQQLQAKQIAAATYGLKDRELRQIYKLAKKVRASTKEIFAQRLECRLDNILYQAGLAFSRRHARQLIGHGKVTVDNKKVSSPSYQVSSGEKIALSQKVIKGKQADSFQRTWSAKEVPGWLKREKENQVTMESLPKDIGDQLGFDIQLIIEFYSR